MRWSEVRKAYPDQWLIIEALQAHTTPDSRRVLDEITMIEQCSDGNTAMQSYRRLHRQHPAREFYFVHTSRDELDIHEQRLIGSRRLHEVVSEGLVAGAVIDLQEMEIEFA